MSTLKINKKLIRMDRKIREGGSADLAEFGGGEWQLWGGALFLTGVKILLQKDLRVHVFPGTDFVIQLSGQVKNQHSAQVKKIDVFY